VIGGRRLEHRGAGGRGPQHVQHQRQIRIAHAEAQEHETALGEGRAQERAHRTGRGPPPQIRGREAQGLDGVGRAQRVQEEGRLALVVAGAVTQRARVQTAEGAAGAAVGQRALPGVVEAGGDNTPPGQLRGQADHRRRVGAGGLHFAQHFGHHTLGQPLPQPRQRRPQATAAREIQGHARGGLRFLALARVALAQPAQQRLPCGRAGQARDRLGKAQSRDEHTLLRSQTPREPRRDSHGLVWFDPVPGAGRFPVAPGSSSIGRSHTIASGAALGVARRRTSLGRSRRPPTSIELACPDWGLLGWHTI
jgi:hypothetical protein